MVFREVTDALFHLIVRKLLPEDTCPSARWSGKRKEDLDERGFPGSIWTEQTEHLALVYLERKPIKCRDVLF